jgi:hypothetical protein
MSGVIADAFKEALEEISESDENALQFASEASSDVALPPAARLTVKGVGKVALPLTNETANALVKAGTPAPFGHGSKTVHDETIRKATQIDASAVVFDDAWREAIDDMTRAVCDDDALDCDVDTDDISAQLHKLVIYGEGGHFRMHRDTEKEPGMFATLAVELPSVQGRSGGELQVLHRGEMRSMAGDGKKLQFIAFFADCLHRVVPVTAGIRCCLLFNLVRGGARGGMYVCMYICMY